MVHCAIVDRMTPVYLIPKQRWTKHYCQKSNLSIGSKNPINQSSHNIHQVYVLRANHAEQNVLCVFHCPLSDWKINLIKGCADTTKKKWVDVFFSPQSSGHEPRFMPLNFQPFKHFKRKIRQKLSCLTLQQKLSKITPKPFNTPPTPRPK